MLKRIIRTLIVLAAAVGVPAAASAAPAAATAVGPNQYFIGSVNSHTDSAVIQVNCPGMSNTGHPLPNQTLGISLLLPPATAAVGYTGSSSSITAWLDWPANTGPMPLPVYKFDSYGTVPLGTGMTVPCSGTGVMSFMPWPLTQGSKVAQVKITFLSLTG